MILLVLLLVFSRLSHFDKVFVLCAVSSDDQEQCKVRVLPPFETYTYVPEGSVVQMICTDAEKSVPVEMLQWQIRLAQTQFTIPALFSSLRDTFISNGINESRQDSMTLQLTISNAVDNNATEVICIKNVVTELSRTTIIVFNVTSNGPIKLSASDITRGSSNISWCSQPNLVGYSDATIYRNYTLKVTEMNTNRTQLIKINDSMTYYVFQAGKNNEVCEVYNFSIIATYEIVGATYTGIDCNVPSTVLSRMLPSVPDTERLNSSLTYSLHLIHSNLKLNISFEPGNSCDDYPVLNYTLEIQSSFSEVVKHFIEPQHFNVIIGNLSENREYSFRIVVTNAIGNASSSDRQFYTTDVQLVTADFDESSDDIIVQCTFIPGSDTQGCMVVLVGESENTTINLTRKGFDTVAVEMINVTCPIINYTQVIGYDIESDESIGLLAVHGKLSFNNRNTFCLPINHGMESTLSVTTILAIMIPATVIIIIIIIIIALLTKKSKTEAFRPSVQSVSGSKLQPPSQPQQHKGLEEESQKTMPLYELPKKHSATENKDKGIVEDTHHPTSKCDKCVVTIENISTYAEITDKEHFYHILENAKKNIPPDPDAPELPPPFKPEPSPPPIYHDILDLQANKVHAAAQK